MWTCVVYARTFIWRSVACTTSHVFHTVGSCSCSSRQLTKMNCMDYWQHNATGTIDLLEYCYAFAPLCIHSYMITQTTRLQHKNGFEPKNSQDIYNVIRPLIQACTKNGYVLAPSPLPCLKEWRVINVLEQAAVKPCVILIRSFSVDRANVVYKMIFYTRGIFYLASSLFFTRLCCRLQFRKLYGYRILNAQ